MPANAEVRGAPPTGGASHTNDGLGAAVSPAPTFADGMTAEDDRRFLELTNDLTHNDGGNARE